MKKKYIVITGQKGYIIPYLLSDLKEMDNVLIQKGNLNFENRLRYILYRIHNSKKINAIINLPGKEKWLHCKYSFLDNYKFNDDCHYIVIILNLAANTIDLNHLEKYRKPNIKFVLAFFDPVSDEYSSSKAFKYRGKFDLVMTFDNEDSQKYGFTYFFQRYSRFELSDSLAEVNVYFVGNLKGRAIVLDKIADGLMENNISYYFRVVDKKRKEKEKHRFTVEKRNISYTEVLEDIAKSKCLLEIVQKGQSGATARYAEAVCYNKLLITNNKNVKKFPYYNPNYIKVIDDEFKIDYEWLRNTNNVNYGYKGDFSPRKWLADIENLLKKGGENG